MGSSQARRIAYRDLKSAIQHVETSLEQPDPAVLSRARRLVALYPAVWGELRKRSNLPLLRMEWVESWITPNDLEPPLESSQEGLFVG